MRKVLWLLIVLVCVPSVKAEDDPKNPKRFDIQADLGSYPQTSPKVAMESILKAIRNDRMDYVIAHMIDPAYIDKRLQDTGFTPKKMRAEMAEHFKADSTLLREMNTLTIGGDYVENNDAATISDKALPDRRIFLKRIGDRWFMENRKMASE